MEKAEEKGKFKDFTIPGRENEMTDYKNKVVFLRRSIKGEHLYAFDYNGAFETAIGGSILMNISDVEALIAGRFDHIKVSIMPKKEKEEEDAAKS